MLRHRCHRYSSRSHRHVSSLTLRKTFKLIDSGGKIEGMLGGEIVAGGKGSARDGACAFIVLRPDQSRRVGERHVHTSLTANLILLHSHRNLRI